LCYLFLFRYLIRLPESKDSLLILDLEERRFSSKKRLKDGKLPRLLELSILNSSTP